MSSDAISLVNLQDALLGRNSMYVETLMPDRHPHVTKVWATFVRGFVLISILKKGRTYRNVIRDKKVSVSVMTPAEKSVLLASADCTVVGIMQDKNCEYASLLAQQYGSDGRKPLDTKKRRVLLKAVPSQVYALPPISKDEVIEHLKNLDLTNDD